MRCSSVPGVVQTASAGSRAETARWTVCGSAPSLSRRSIRDRRPSRPSGDRRHCAVPRSITASRWPGAAPGTVPATRSTSRSSPTRRLIGSPTFRPKASSAGCDRKIASASKSETASPCVTGISAGVTASAANGSMAISRNERCCGSTTTSVSITGLRPATPSIGGSASCASSASSKPSRRARTCA